MVRHPDRMCAWCGKGFNFKRNTPVSKQRFCSDAHRLAAWRFANKFKQVSVWGEKL